MKQPWGVRIVRIARVCLLAGGGAAGMLVFQSSGCLREGPPVGGLTDLVLEEGTLVPVTLRVLDHGEPTPARLYFEYLPQRRPYVLGPEVGYSFPLFVDRYWQDRYFLLNKGIPVLDLVFHDGSRQGRDHHYYWLTGEATVRMVPGRYRVTAYKGPEYQPVQSTFEVAQSPVRHNVVVERWTDMPAQGWYGGDVHIHLARNGREDPVYLAMQEADGVHVGHYLQLQLLWQGAVQTMWGDRGERRQNDAILRSGEESRSLFGHTLLLGIKDLILPVGQDWNDFRPLQVRRLTADIFAEARQSGGVVGYAHGDGLNSSSAAAVDLALGGLDFVEIYQFNRFKPWFWYQALSAGYRLPPAAGTDFPANLNRWDPYPPMMSPLSAERTYVHVNGAYTYEAWMEGLVRGRVILTNGPMVDFRIDDHGPGEEVRLDASTGQVIVQAVIEHWRPMKEARLIMNGDTVRTFRNTARATRWTLQADLPVPSSSWMALHVISDSTGTYADEEILIQALTGAVYVLRGDRPIRHARGIEGLIQRVEASRREYTSSRWQYADPAMLDRLTARCDGALEEYRRRLAAAQ